MFAAEAGKDRGGDLCEGTASLWKAPSVFVTGRGDQRTEVEAASKALGDPSRHLSDYIQGAQGLLPSQRVEQYVANTGPEIIQSQVGVLAGVYGGAIGRRQQPGQEDLREVRRF
ncbi:hypothetical protein QA862_07975 [Streptomyces sp. B21-101]